MGAVIHFQSKKKKKKKKTSKIEAVCEKDTHNVSISVKHSDMQLKWVHWLSAVCYCL